ncbi:hypothetical protein BZA05DRAFT_339423 [Tricharina praecox]|uniref:uncharacterized protein n=1 Tax=Tricharina praecox TaxID=43433 RepID=UPI002221091B|nr:uncharacterized protein BZA05DRAFT_339423 [Tricharina praecox]KAI5849068.1 hypothetical protein BZA05DRAFT_339423 [Tricharina praecox]
MVLDYSKWDKIELSDDSDIEVHPNVDKRSFINAKRRQIHENRSLRKQQMNHYKTEIAMNDHLLSMLDKLIATLGDHSAEPAADMVMHALIQLSTEDNSNAPQVPVGTPGYAQMIAALVDTIKKEIDEENPADRWKAFLDKLRDHRGKLQQQTKDTYKKLADLEKEEKAKITSDDVHEGFSAGHVNKKEVASSSSMAASKKKSVSKVQAVEQLNRPSAIGFQPSGDQSVSSGAEADIEEIAGEEDDDDEQHFEPTALGKEFAKIKIGEYNRCLAFIRENPAVVSEKETDGLLIDAFNSQIAGKDVYAKQCVHQALLLQYCRQLGSDGVSLFFKRITTAGHHAQKVFYDDVHQTYSRIKERAREISSEQEKGSQGVEQIQLHAVDPNTTINISIPPASSDDPEEKQAREVFESFPPGLRRALESGSLDEVNKVLGKMSVEEAEEIVGQLGEGGMLSLESQIIDATTEDGQKMLHELEEQEARAKSGTSGDSGTDTTARNKGKNKETENPLAAEVD